MESVDALVYMIIRQKEVKLEFRRFQFCHHQGALVMRTNIITTLAEYY